MLNEITHLREDMHAGLTLLGVSLGKTNFCFKALVDKGLIKVQSFRKCQSKLACAFLLTALRAEANQIASKSADRG